ncbi:Short-chain dehydrogenase/reductase 2b [Nymphaea thermarum]|nr:Short-chain dehydrogenase/reductase 2b [Nymphaea thermarum]
MGGNRGMGLEVCRQLADKGLTVIMTARQPQEQLSVPAQQFLQEAAEAEKNVLFHTLDITEQQSMLDFVDWLRLRVGFIDVLANFDCGGGTRESYESAKECIDTNYYGTVKLTKALLPFLRLSPHKARIVMVSSIAGLLCHIRDEGLRKQLLETEGLTEQKIDGVLNLFLEDLKSEKAMEKWPLKLPAYSISKASLNAYGSHLALQLNGVAYVNSVHPGAVKTNMTDCTGNLSPIEGAENIEAEGSEWWSGETVAVVTGGNRGIGLEICRQLADKGLTVIMTARKPQEQLSSSAQLFLQEAPRKNRRRSSSTPWILLNSRKQELILKVQVNFTCAGGTSESYESAKECIDTNYYGTKRLTDALLPFLRPSPYKARIVMVSALAGQLCYVRDGELRRQLSETEGLTEQKIHGVLNLFLDDLKSEKAMEKWPLKMPAYSISKASLNAYVRLLSRRLKGIVCVNSVHPGIVRTDMTDFIGNLSPTEGAENVLRVALFPVGGPSGHNFLEREDSEF